MTRSHHHGLVVFCVLLSTAANSTSPGPSLPLRLVADVALPGRARRFDYQEIDARLGLLVVAHMNDDAVLILDLADGSLRKRITGIPTPRGVAIADEVGIIFVTSAPNHLVLIDDKSSTKLGQVETGRGPDGTAWDSGDEIVGVSDQRDGALSLISNGGRGRRTQVPLGVETGNVVYDRVRKWFWITVVTARPPNRLVAVDPVAAKVTTTIALPGCGGAHGLRLHPDGQSAFVACEQNDRLARVALGGAPAISTAPTGAGPDVLALDPGLGWLYVAAESGDLTVFDVNRPGLALVGHDHPGRGSHSVLVDPTTHRVFFPLAAGSTGSPTLRIMRPSGT